MPNSAGITAIPAAAAIAVAGPVTDGKARFTNRGWEISEEELKKFGFKEALLINDFAALAFAVGILDEKDLRPWVRSSRALARDNLDPWRGYRIRRVLPRPLWRTRCADGDRGRPYRICAER